jgi:hypothetical protein
LKVSEPGSPVVNPAYSIASKRIDSQKLICAPCLVLRRLVAVAMPSTARDKMLTVLMFYSVVSVYLECIYQRNNNHCKRFVNGDRRQPVSTNVKPAGCNSSALKTDLCRHRLAMLIAQVPVSPHRQGTAVFMSKPPADGRDIDAAFNASGREQVPQIVPSHPVHTDLGTCCG